MKKPKKSVAKTTAYARKRSRAGLGLFATRVIKKGERILEYTGERMTPDEADKRGGQYLFEVTKRITIDGKGRENIGRYINHACAPNAEAIIEGTRVFVYSTQAILPGEEITYDYGKEFFDEYIKPKGCRCIACKPDKITILERSSSKTLAR